MILCRFGEEEVSDTSRLRIRSGAIVQSIIITREWKSKKKENAHAVQYASERQKESKTDTEEGICNQVNEPPQLPNRWVAGWVAQRSPGKAEM